MSDASPPKPRKVQTPSEPTHAASAAPPSNPLATLPGNPSVLPPASPQANAPESFFEKYGDKVISAVLGGVVGFFSAIMTTKGDIAKLNERLVGVETQNKNDEPKLGKLDQNLQEMDLIRQRLSILEKKEETAGLISRLLEERMRAIRLETLKELGTIAPKTDTSNDGANKAVNPSGGSGSS